MNTARGVNLMFRRGRGQGSMDVDGTGIYMSKTF